MGNYTVTSHCLGAGAFATVHLAFDNVNYRQAACKTVRTKKETEMRQFMKEVDILSGLRHVYSSLILFACLILL
jgi:serine/threonine protein kinase